MLLKDVYQVIEGETKLVPGDEFALASIADKHIWAPCSSFLGRRVCDVSPNGRIIFRRLIAQDEAAV